MAKQIDSNQKPNPRPIIQREQLKESNMPGHRNPPPPPPKENTGENK
jgi:hypothetical protein